MDFAENEQDLKAKALEIRRMSLEMCSRAGTGHVTSGFSCTEILVALYYGGILRIDPSDPESPDRDRFILSKGHASVCLYPILADLGFFPRSELDRFCGTDGIFGVHLQHQVPGVETTSGSLGHGLGIATGLALAARKRRESHLIVTLLGDGECYSGSIWESSLFASGNRLGNLTAIVDRNGMSATNFTEPALPLESLQDKWKAFGWETKTINGHDFSQIFQALAGLRSFRRSAPLVIIAETVKGKGIDFISNQCLWHARAPKGEELERARGELNPRGDEHEDSA
jgi:transketolase